jgi:NTP pyrophosphatase (non-canonical NTP hydrolase)
MACGLAEEAGEVLGKIKKQYRDGELDEKALKKELGDVVFYWARICRYYGFSPSSVLDANVEKIRGRKKRGTQHGNGDNR